MHHNASWLMVILGTNRHDRKHYLLTTSFAGGIKKIRSENLLHDKQTSHHSTMKTQVTDRIFKIDPNSWFSAFKIH